ncbi:MAG: 1-acyl-sn-glycerol-3-phosphate acyltransferase [Candidatus Krumholzibacteriota bacterium]
MAPDPRRLLALLLHLLVLRPFLHLVFGLNVRGRENLPTRGPCILAANHNSHLDILTIYGALPIRLVMAAHVVAAYDYFARHRLLFATVDFLFKPVWVDRNCRGGDTLDMMNGYLEAGESIIIFPEGTRGEAGQIGNFHCGVGRLAADHPEVPLLPVYLRGTERALPRKSSLPLPIWQHISIGPPQRLDAGVRDTTEALRESILALERSEIASRHQRRPDRRRTFVVAVLGIDGSGKSTLSRRLSLDLSQAGRTCLIGDSLELFADGDPCAAQPLLKEKLRRWVSAQAKDAKSLARYKIPKLTELLLRDALLGETKRWYGSDLIFMDGSPILNMTAWSILYRPEMMSADFCARAMAILAGRGSAKDPLFSEFPELKVMKRLGLTRLAMPDAVIFLDIPAAVSMNRIRNRGEKMQVHETEEKLGRLREAYLLVVKATAEKMDLPTFILDGDRDLESIATEARRAVEGARPESGGNGE